MKKTIALLYGGASKEHDVSVMGHKYILNLLANTEYNAVPVYINRDGEWLLNGEDVFPRFRSRGGELVTDYGACIKVDAAIPLLHGDGGESGEIQGMLSAAKIPFIGAEASTGALCLDKHYTKCIAKNLGIPTVDWVCFKKNCPKDTALSICKERLGFPLFLKPRRLGSSIGAFTARNEKEFEANYPEAIEISGGLLMAEKLVTNKRELECAFYSALGKTVISPPGEILTDGFYGYNEKYINSARTSSRADIDSITEDDIVKYSSLLSEACELRHLGRIDYFLTEDGLFFNEINTFPGFTDKSLYPKMLYEIGITPKDAILSFIEDALC